jgi:NADH-quinone oxidoreductase subunit C
VSDASNPAPDEVAETTTPEPELLHGVPVVERRGERTLHPSRDELLALVGALRADGYVQCSDLTAVDYLSTPQLDLPPGVAPERFVVVVQLLSHVERRRLRIRVQVPEDDATVPSLFELFPGTEAPEREVFDLFGIAFEGHPDLTRILMPEDWVGHPLRKDYGVGRIPVQFKGAPT